MSMTNKKTLAHHSFCWCSTMELYQLILFVCLFLSVNGSLKTLFVSSFVCSFLFSFCLFGDWIVSAFSIHVILTFRRNFLVPMICQHFDLRPQQFVANPIAYARPNVWMHLVAYSQLESTIPFPCYPTFSVECGFIRPISLIQHQLFSIFFVSLVSVWMISA